MFRLVCKPAFKLASTYHYCPKAHYPCRAISTTPRRNADDDSHHDNLHCDDSNIGGTGSKSDSVSFTTRIEFCQLDKDVSNVKLKLDLKLDHFEAGLQEVKGEIKDVSSKMGKKFDKTDGKIDKTYSRIDRVLFIVITSVVGFFLKAGFDYYLALKK